jgi:hypothetical protein
MAALAAGIERQISGSRGIKRCAATFGADKTIRSLHGKQIAFASLFTGKTLLKFEETEFILFSHQTIPEHIFYNSIIANICSYIKGNMSKGYNQITNYSQEIKVDLSCHAENCVSL